MPERAAGGETDARPDEPPIQVLVPVFEDWAAVSALLPALDRALGAAGLRAGVLLVDDGSSTPPRLEGLPALERIGPVRALRLARNLGHQRAICIGLTWVHEHLPGCETLVIMDGDGEDRPEDVPRLVAAVEAGGGERIVFAARMRRSEGLPFLIGYTAFRVLHRLLVGHAIRVGNFSAVPRSILRRLVVVSELWNHYAAGVFASRLPHTSIPTHRGTRLAGRGKMNFVALVTHGMSALSVYGDRIGVRLLLLDLAGLAVALTGAAGLAGLRPLLGIQAPTWLLALGAGFLVILTVLLVVAGAAVGFLLGNRSQGGFIPVRDHHHFVLECLELRA